MFVRVIPLLLKLKHSIFISPFFTFVQAEVHTLPASLNDSVHMVIGQVASLQRSRSMKPKLDHLLSTCCFVLHTGLVGKTQKHTGGLMKIGPAKSSLSMFIRPSALISVLIIWKDYRVETRETICSDVVAQWLSMDS